MLEGPDRGQAITTLIRPVPARSIASSGAGNRIAFSQLDGAPQSWDLETHQLVSGPRPRSFVNSIAFDPRGEWIATGDDAGVVNIWSATTGQLSETYEQNSAAVVAVAFSPDGRFLAMASDTVVAIWNRADGSTQVLQHDRRVLALAFQPGSNRIATGAGNTVRLWDLQTISPTGEILYTHEGLVRALTFSDDGSRLASASADNTAIVWGVELQSALEPSLQHPGNVLSVDFDNTGTRLATSTDEGAAYLWQVAASPGRSDGSRRPLSSFAQHSGVVWGAQFDQESRRVVTAAEDGALKVWSFMAPGLSPLVTLDHRVVQSSGPVRSLGISGDGQVLLSGTVDGIATVWDGTTGTMKSTKDLEAPVRSSVFNDTGNVGAFGADNGKTAIVNVKRAIVQGPQLSSAVRAMAFNSSGTILAVGDIAGAAVLWDMTKSTSSALPHFGAGVTALAFSPDDRWLVVAGADGSLHLGRVDSKSGMVEFDSTGPISYSGPIRDLAFSPVGNGLVTVDELDGLLVRQLKDVVGPPDHFDGTAPARAVAVSPDGNQVAVGSDSTLRIVDVRGRRDVSSYTGTGVIAGLTFGPSGQTLLVSRIQGSTELVRVSDGAVLANLGVEPTDVSGA